MDKLCLTWLGGLFAGPLGRARGLAVAIFLCAACACAMDDGPEFDAPAPKAKAARPTKTAAEPEFDAAAVKPQADAPKADKAAAEKSGGSTGKTVAPADAPKSPDLDESAGGGVRKNSKAAAANPVTNEAKAGQAEKFPDNAAAAVKPSKREAGPDEDMSRAAAVADEMAKTAAEMKKDASAIGTTAATQAARPASTASSQGASSGQGAAAGKQSKPAGKEGAPAQPAQPPTSLVQLDGSESLDPAHPELVFHWKQVGGPSVTLSDASSPKPFFRTNVPGTYKFELVVSSGKMSSEPALVEVEVEKPNFPPEAILAKDVDAVEGNVIVIDGSRSRDADGDRLHFQWKQRSGPPLFLNPEALQKKQLEIKEAKEGIYEFELVVTDGKTFSKPAACRLVVKKPEGPPVARAAAVGTVILSTPPELKASQSQPGAPVAIADQEVVTSLGAQVVLDGSRSTSPRNRPLKYYWEQRAGEEIAEYTILENNPAKYAFVPKRSGNFEFDLTVNDGELDSVPLRVVVHVVDGKALPVARITAAATVKLGEDIVLDGSQSFDREGLSLSYGWRQVEGPRITEVGVAGQSSKAVFKPKEVGTYVFELVVSANSVESKPVRATVSVITVNRAPSVATISKVVVEVGETFTLKADGSDPENDPLSYEWRQNSGPAELLPKPTRQQSVELAGKAAGDYRFQVVADDGKQLSSPAFCSVKVEKRNHPPVIEVKPVSEVGVSDPVVLDASGSKDPDGDALSFSWKLAKDSPRRDGELARPETVMPTFVAGSAGKYALELTVSDNQGASSTLRLDLEAKGRNLPPTAEVRILQNGNGRASLDASASRDPESVPLDFAWKQVSGPAVGDGAGTQSARYSATLQGGERYVFSVAVSDGVNPPQVKEAAVTGAYPPPRVEVSAPTSVASGDVAVLDASASKDAGGRRLTYTWKQTSGPAKLLPPEGKSGEVLRLEPSKPGDYVFSLTVSNGRQEGSEEINLKVVAPE